MSLASVFNRNHNNVRKPRGDLFSSYMVMIGCLGALQTLSRRFEDPSVGMAAPDGWRARRHHGKNGTAGSIPVSASCDRNHGPSLESCDGIARREGKLIGEPTAVMCFGGNSR